MKVHYVPDEMNTRDIVEPSLTYFNANSFQFFLLAMLRSVRNCLEVFYKRCNKFIGIAIGRYNMFRNDKCISCSQDNISGVGCFHSASMYLPWIEFDTGRLVRPNNSSSDIRTGDGGSMNQP